MRIVHVVGCAVLVATMVACTDSTPRCEPGAPTSVACDCPAGTALAGTRSRRMCHADAGFGDCICNSVDASVQVDAGSNLDSGVALDAGMVRVDGGDESVDSGVASDAGPPLADGG